MPWLGTFHSIGGRILRIHAELVQLKSNFTVLDVDDQVRLLKQLLQADNIDDKRWPARMLAGLIDGWKNRGLTPSQVPAGEAAVFGNGKGGKLYAQLSGAAEDPQRRRFRRSAAGKHPAVPRAPRCAPAIPEPLQVHPGRRISGHQRRAVSVAAAAVAGAVAAGRPLSAVFRARSPRPACRGAVDGEASKIAWRSQDGSVSRLSVARDLSPQAGRGSRSPPPRPSKTSAASATTTSRSMAGAARRSTTSCASTTIFPAPR